MSTASDIASYTARLEKVRTAIEAVLTGQEVDNSGQRWRGANLSDLYTLEEKYAQKISELEAIQSGGHRILARRGTA